MPNDTYNQNPALRPTVLAHEVLKNRYVPGLRALPPARPDASDDRITRETPRAA